MSSFVVTNKTINQVVSHLQTCDSKRTYDHWMRQAMGFSLTNTQELVDHMLSLNLTAIYIRYGDEPSGVAYTFRHVPVTEIQAYKSLQCWLYQCTEGKASTNPFYKVMERIAGSIASHIISKLPGYEKAHWDAPESTHEVELISLSTLAKGDK